MNTTPIYYHSATYARDHGELDQYRATSKECATCCRDIETIISARFDGMHLERVAVDEALAIHGAELVGLVLSSTILYKEWDGRFSRRSWTDSSPCTARRPPDTGRQGAKPSPLVADASKARRKRGEENHDYHD